MSRPIHGVLLAAGGSSRLGRPKQLLRVAGKSLVAEVAGRLQGAGVDRVVVVAGAEEEQVRATLSRVLVEIVFNPRWREGMGTSVAAGVAHSATAGAAAVLIAVTDQPGIEEGHYRNLIERHLLGDATVATGYPDGPGVPAVFPSGLFARLTALEGDRGGRDILREEDVEIVLNAAATHDIDYPEDV